MPENCQWGGEPIKFETEYVLTQKIKSTLEHAGSSLADVVKAHIHLTHLDDIAPFKQVWAKHFPTGHDHRTLPRSCARHAQGPDRNHGIRTRR